MEGSLRLMEGQAGPGYEYGRLEIFRRGFWSTICDRPSISPDAAGVACRILGYDGGAGLQFRGAFERSFENEVTLQHSVVHCHQHWHVTNS